MQITDLQNGYHQAGAALACNYCAAHLSTPAAMAAHQQAAHGGALAALLAAGGLTATQQALLAAFASGQSDKQIAEAHGVSASTVRQQKYRFRQKAAAARLFLAQYQAVFGDETPPTLLAVPQAAQVLKLTETGYQAALLHNLDGTTLTHWPKKESTRLALTARLAQEFSFTMRYSGQAVKAKLAAWYEDTAVLTRYLVDYGYLDRTADGREYWRIF